MAGAVAHAACTTAMDIKANAIITVSKSGETARLLCKYRPETPIIACVLTEQVYRQLTLSWGITPIMMEYAHDTDELIEKAVSTSQSAGLVQDGDLVVITAGVPVGISGTTNMIKAHLVGDALLSGIGIGRTATASVLPVCAAVMTRCVKTKFKPGNVLVVPGNEQQYAGFHPRRLRHHRRRGRRQQPRRHRRPYAGQTGCRGRRRALPASLHDGVTRGSVDGERGVVHSMPQ